MSEQSEEQGTNLVDMITKATLPNPVPEQNSAAVNKCPDR